MAIFFSALIAIAGVLGAAYFAVTSNKALEDAKSAYNDSVTPAQEAYTTSQKADTIMNAESSVALIRDATLATDMTKDNDAYPDLYDSLKPFIPTWFRVNSMSATPTSSSSATVTIVGTLDTYQQYANLMLAFSRFPGVVSVSRSGFDDRSVIVTNLTPGDQIGKPHTADAAPIPDDKYERLSYFQSTAQAPQGYTGVGNFGSGTDNTRGAMPTSSLVVVNLPISNKDLTVPDPRATLSSSGGGAAAGGPPIGGPPGGIPGAGAGAPPPPPGAGAAAAAGQGAGKRKSSKASDDE